MHKHNPTFHNYDKKETNANELTLNTDSCLRNGRHFGTHCITCPGVVKNMKDCTDIRERVQDEKRNKNTNIPRRVVGDESQSFAARSALQGNGLGRVVKCELRGKKTLLSSASVYGLRRDARVVA